MPASRTLWCRGRDCPAARTAAWAGQSSCRRWRGCLCSSSEGVRPDLGTLNRCGFASDCTVGLSHRPDPAGSRRTLACQTPGPGPKTHRGRCGTASPGRAAHGCCASCSRYVWGLGLELIGSWTGRRPLGPGQPENRRTRGHPSPPGTRPPPHPRRTGYPRLAWPAWPAGLAVAGRDFERPITDVLGTTVIRPDRGEGIHASANPAASGNGSNPSLTPSRADPASNTTGAAPSPASTTASQPASCELSQFVGVDASTGGAAWEVVPVSNLFSNSVSACR